MIEGRMGGAKEMQRKVAATLDGDYCSVAHTLLQAVPSGEAITMNYDRLFEKACKDGGRPVKVLPYDYHSMASRRHQRWLLKMHGCVQHPEDIVLTREDYITYNERRQSLSGMVQSQARTLFVEFALKHTVNVKVNLSRERTTHIITF